MLKAGHRGAMGYEPQNTLRSFQKAIDLGVDMIELDVHKCKSGEIIVIHDDILDKKTNGIGKVSELTLEELKQFTVKPPEGIEPQRKNEKIPTLKEVFDLVEGKIKINVEIKARGAVRGTVKLIEEYVQKNYTYESFLVSSFDYRDLIKVRLLNPRIRLGILAKKKFILLNLLFAQLLKARSINIFYKNVSEKLIKRAHSLDLKVLVWTVDEPQDIKRMKELGVDGIFSNYPDRIK